MTMDADPLPALIAAARRGDPEAFGRIVEAIHFEVRIFIASRSADGSLVEEVVQQALITAWRNLDAFDGRGAFVSWVKGIALNHLRKELSTRARRPQQDLAAILAREDARALDDGDEDPRLDRLRRCLERLGAGVRRVLDLRYRDGLDLDALAERMGRPAGTLAVQFHRVRKSLRTCIEQGGGAP
jgi:RNA polymerase sigma-70 factor (ECF subfamily)